MNLDYLDEYNDNFERILNFMNESISSFVSWVTTQSIQVGFDIATSLSIIFAALTVMVSSILKTRSERQRGINERALSTSLNRVIDITSEFEDAFSELVEAAQGIEYPIDKLLDRNGVDTLREKLCTDNNFAPTIVKRLDNFRDGIGNYYEAIQKRRYTLIPLLDSIPNEASFVPTLQKDIDDISRLYNQIGRNEFSLLQELLEIHKHADALIEQHPDLSEEDKIKLLLDDEKMSHLSVQMFYDPDYLYWTKSFVSDEQKDDFEAYVKDTDFKSGKEIFNSAHINLCIGIVSEPMKFVAQAMVYISYSVQQARSECKDILIKLAAMNHKLLAKGSNESLLSIIDKYESKEYFDSKKSIR